MGDSFTFQQKCSLWVTLIILFYILSATIKYGQISLHGHCLDVSREQKLDLAAQVLAII